MPDNFGDKRNSNGFDKNPQNRGNGRKKKIYTVVKELGYSADDMRTAYKEIGFYSQKELIELWKDESKPMILRIVANQYIAAFKKDDLGKIKDIIEQVTGKAHTHEKKKKQTDTEQPENFSNLTFEQIHILKYGKKPE